MNNCVELKLENDTVRFTPDGRIAVIDAIRALCDKDNPDGIWEDLKLDYPDIVEMCGNYTFPRKGAAPVAGSAGWMVIETKLLEHLIDNNL